jgi:hypothetical protein
VAVFSQRGHGAVVVIDPSSSTDFTSDLISSAASSLRGIRLHAHLSSLAHTIIKAAAVEEEKEGSLRLLEDQEREAVTANNLSLAVGLGETVFSTSRWELRSDAKSNLVECTCSVRLTGGSLGFLKTRAINSSSLKPWRLVQTCEYFP